MTSTHLDDKPKSLGCPGARAAREAELHDPHIAPLTDFVDKLRGEKGTDFKIPYFDPWDGGIAAEVLFLLEAPGAKAVASGFISRNNPDETAKNFFELNLEAGLCRQRTITWNIVPWYIGSGSRVRPATSDDIRIGIQPLISLLDLLPKLRAIVLLGKMAQRGSMEIKKLRANVRVFNAPHPSPLFVNKSPANREKIRVVLRAVAEFMDTTGTDNRPPSN